MKSNHLLFKKNYLLIPFYVIVVFATITACHKKKIDSPEPTKSDTHLLTENSFMIGELEGVPLTSSFYYFAIAYNMNVESDCISLGSGVVASNMDGTMSYLYASDKPARIRFPSKLVNGEYFVYLQNFPARDSTPVNWKIRFRSDGVNDDLVIEEKRIPQPDRTGCTNSMFNCRIKLIKQNNQLRIERF